MSRPFFLSKYRIRRLDCRKTRNRCTEETPTSVRSAVSFLKSRGHSCFKPSYNFRTIGNLPQGTPCTLRYHSYGAVYGFVQKPTNDHKMMEVYIPMYEQCVYVTRDEVMPLSSTPREIRSLPRYPQDSHHFRQAGDIARKPVVSF